MAKHQQERREDETDESGDEHETFKAKIAADRSAEHGPDDEASAEGDVANRIDRTVDGRVPDVDQIAKHGHHRRVDHSCEIAAVRHSLVESEKASHASRRASERKAPTKFPNFNMKEIYDAHGTRLSYTLTTLRMYDRAQ